MRGRKRRLSVSLIYLRLTEENDTSKGKEVCSRNWKLEVTSKKLHISNIWKFEDISGHHASCRHLEGHQDLCMGHVHY